MTLLLEKSMKSVTHNGNQLGFNGLGNCYFLSQRLDGWSSPRNPDKASERCSTDCEYKQIDCIIACDNEPECLSNCSRETLACLNQCPCHTGNFNHIITKWAVIFESDWPFRFGIYRTFHRKRKFRIPRLNRPHILNVYFWNRWIWSATF